MTEVSRLLGAGKLDSLGLLTYQPFSEATEVSGVSRVLKISADDTGL